MKKMLLVAALLAALTGAVWAQDVLFDAFRDSFQDFAGGVANSLPISAATGLNWSPAYIGQFPHFGVGLSVGGMFIPYETVEPIIAALGAGTTVPAQLRTYGIPFPTIALGARMGGFGLPFDMGFKIGLIPESAKELFSSNVTADYFLIGGDVRLPVVHGKGLVPTVSIGGGYTFVRGRIGVADVSTGETINLTTEMVPYLGGTTHELVFTDPDLFFAWDTHTIDAKAQASWNALIFTPHIGIGAAYGISKAGGGLSSTLAYNTDSGATLSDLQAALEGAGYGQLSADSLEVLSEANGWSFWVYGGTAINILILKIDLSAMYNFLNGDYGGSVNVRVQF